MVRLICNFGFTFPVGVGGSEGEDGNTPTSGPQ